MRRQVSIPGWVLWTALVVPVLPHPAAGISYQGTLTIDILDGLFEIPQVGSGDASFDPATGAFDLAAGAFVLTDFGGDFPPNTPRDIIPSIVAGALTSYATAPGQFAPRLDGTVGGPMAMLGTFDFLSAGGVVLLSILLDPIGQGGTAMTTALGGALTTLTTGEEWTTGQVTADDVIVGGVPGQSISRSGWDLRGADGLGSIRLVTASEMSIDSPSGGFFVKVPTFATLDLSFVPEPQRAVLLAVAGIAAAALLRRRRVRT